MTTTRPWPQVSSLSPRRAAAAATVALCTGLAFAPAPASAQAVDGGLDAQTFTPAVGPYSIFTVEGSETLDHLAPAGGLMFSYGSEPLVEYFEQTDETRPIVDQQLTLHALAGIGLWDRFQFDVAFPLLLVNDIELAGEDLSGVTTGDLHLRPKATILAREGDGIGLGALVDLGLPTGDEDAFAGSSGVTVTPKALIDGRFGPILLAANVGVRVQEDRTLRNVDLGEALTYGLGGEVEFLRGLLRVGGELYGSSYFGDFFNEDETPLEGVLGAKLVTTSGFIVSAGGGGGIVSGVGSPEFRAFLGLGWAAMENDFDDDGIPNDQDECPELAEDKDGFEDADGCPDEDNDGDGIADAEDQCPDQPEDLDGDRDEDGCPEEAADSDEDGLADDEDQCPEQAEDLDGFEDEDGCPDPDNDGDGIPDERDGCPTDAEDKDGFEDADGCPDPDNDGDGIPDAQDECPEEPGVAADKGCPPAEVKAVREVTEIKILDKVYFETDKAVIKPESFYLLDQVALVLRTNPDIRKVEIGGHTDYRGTDEYNQELSQARADAVRDYLVGQGIAAERLVAKGYGESKPVDTARTEAAMTKNRRVEFNILEQGGDVEQEGAVIEDTDVEKPAPGEVSE